MTLKNVVLAFTSLLLFACSGETPDDDNDLPRLNALPEFTVSGVSAGAYLAGQLHVAYAAEVTGAGLVAGGPWGCAAGSIKKALGACMTGAGLETSSLTDAAAELVLEQQIDDLRHLGNDQVFIFHGAKDGIVAESVSAAAADWYKSAAPDAKIVRVDNVPATHGWPTLASGAPCDEFAKPWINACDYDLAGAMLNHLLGPLNEPEDLEMPLRRFRQKPFAATSMGDEGMLYVPAECAKGRRCRVHVFLHGCQQALGQVGSVLAEQSGLLRWAAVNDLIVLFPQAAPSQLAPVNPLACWDWWGYSGANYLQKDAPQLAAIRAMVKRLQEDSDAR